MGTARSGARSMRFARSPSAIDEGHTEVVDADLSKYFDTIPHSALMTSVARRISDGKMLQLIKMWLKAPVVETDETGNRRMSGGKKATRGTPQGGVVTPRTQKVTFSLSGVIAGWRDAASA